MNNNKRIQKKSRKSPTKIYHYHHLRSHNRASKCISKKIRKLEYKKQFVAAENANEKCVRPGYNDLESQRPDLAAEWHPTKNGDIKPSQVAVNSRKKVWWLCKQGHEFEEAIDTRCKSKGCPVENGRILIVGINDLETVRPDIAAEWHPSKNGNLKPSQVTVSSGKLIWWMCPNKHVWQTPVYVRTRGHGCPAEFGTKLVKGCNDLQTLRPDLATEWHPTKNGDLKPSQISICSRQKVWWLCENGHDWEATVQARSLGKTCPCTSGQMLISGYNDLATLRPDIAVQWHPQKNGDLKPSQVSLHSRKYIWWICENGHEWNTTVANRVNSKGCPYESGRKVLVGYNDLATERPDIAAQWHPSKNGNLKPTQVTKSSHKKVWWICENGHDWEATVYDRTKHSGTRNGSGCPYECGQKVLPGFNDLATLEPDVAKEWHPTKNSNLKPNQVTINSSKKVWWLSKNGDEWKTAISLRTRKKTNAPQKEGRKKYYGKYQKEPS